MALIAPRTRMRITRIVMSDDTVQSGTPGCGATTRKATTRKAITRKASTHKSHSMLNLRPSRRSGTARACSAARR